MITPLAHIDRPFNRFSPTSLHATDGISLPVASKHVLPLPHPTASMHGKAPISFNLPTRLKKIIGEMSC